MHQDWLSTVQFSWTPIITYTRRHLALLDWFERNIQPVAFIDRPETGALGVAIVAADLRLTVKRSGMVLESGLSGLPIANLADAVSGVFEVLEPRSVLATQYLSTGTVPIDDADADYHQLCAGFGAITSHNAFSGSEEWRATDGSAVVDLTSETMAVQVEWGIVQAKELCRRLADPRMSRLSGRTGDLKERANLAGASLAGHEIPPVSVFVDQVGFWRIGGGVNDVSDVMKRVTEAKQTASTVATGLADRFCSTTREEAT